LNSINRNNAILTSRYTCERLQFIRLENAGFYHSTYVAA